MNTDIFISYSHADYNAAVAVNALLTLGGARTFLDEKDIRGGQNFAWSVFDAISKTRCTIVLISQTSCQSRWVREEYSAARVSELDGRSTIVIPVLLEGTPELLPSPLRHLKFRDMRDYLDDEEILRRCVRQLLEDTDIIPRFTGTENTISNLKNSAEFIACIGACFTLYGYASLANPLPQWASSEIATSMGKYLHETSGVTALELLPNLLKAIDLEPSVLASDLSRAELLIDSMRSWAAQDAGKYCWHIYQCERDSLYFATLLSVFFKKACLDVSCTV